MIYLAFSDSCFDCVAVRDLYTTDEVQEFREDASRDCCPLCGAKVEKIHLSVFSWELRGAASSSGLWNIPRPAGAFKGFSEAADLPPLSTCPAAEMLRSRLSDSASQRRRDICQRYNDIAQSEIALSIGLAAMRDRKYDQAERALMACARSKGIMRLSAKFYLRRLRKVPNARRLPLTIEDEYRKLLAQEGFERILEPLDPRAVRRLMDYCSKEERKWLGKGTRKLIYDSNYLAGRRNLFEKINDDIRMTLSINGVRAPGEVYVGAHPHRQYNAKSRAVRSGTLILIYAGVRILLNHATIAVGESISTMHDRRVRGGMRFDKETEEQRRRKDAACERFARALITHFGHVDMPEPVSAMPTFTPKGVLGILLADSAEYFAVTHEYGHLLAGTLHNPLSEQKSGKFRAGSPHPEDEADELGALLIMSAFDGPSELIRHGLRKSDADLWKQIAIAGPFLFLAIQHLVARARKEVFDIDGNDNETHPPSDERATHLRALFKRFEYREYLQMGEALVVWLSTFEDEIIERTRRMLPDGNTPL